MSAVWYIDGVGYKIPSDAKCVVCGQPHPTDFVLTDDGNAMYFHRECFNKELPKEAMERVWRQL